MSDILNRFMDNTSEETAVDASKKVKVGIIGTGWIAEAHIRSYLRQPDVEIVAGADLVPGKADAFFKKFGVEGVRTYGSAKEMIDNEPDLDAVSVCTYNCQHAPCAIYALEHGLNVLLEKPMCVTVEEAAAILALTPKAACEPLAKLLKSAVANAENNFNMDKNNLYVAECFVCPGPMLKRIRPRAQGRAFRVMKRTSHVTMVLREKE